MPWPEYLAGEGSLASRQPYRFMSAARRKKRAEVLQAKRERMKMLMGTAPIMTDADHWLRLEGRTFEPSDTLHPVLDDDLEAVDYDEAVGPPDPHAMSRVYDWVEDPGLARVVNEMSGYVDWDWIAEVRRKERIRIREEAEAERKALREIEPEPEWQPPPAARKKERTTEEQRAQRRRNREAEEAFERARGEAVSARQRQAARVAAEKRAEEEMWQKLTREEWSKRRALRRAQMVDA